MYTNEEVKAEVAYRRERLTRDYGKHRSGGARRTFIHLFGRKA
ncbi:hypothetical protein OG474_11820 [Kribbella sp. NBC_01505]